MPAHSGCLLPQELGKASIEQVSKLPFELAVRRKHALAIVGK